MAATRRPTMRLVARSTQPIQPIDKLTEEILVKCDAKIHSNLPPERTKLALALLELKDNCL